MRPDMQVTIHAVARAAGVSKTTASDALRGSGRVSERTRTLVVQVADALGYVPNGSARHLRRASTGTIGLHLPEVLTRSSYYMAFVFGVVERAAERDYDITLITSGRRRTPRADGLLLGDPLLGDPVVEQLMASGLPTVTCERFPGTRQADGIVWSRHAAEVGKLLDHLRERGASRPALIVTGGESDWAASVHHGYREWCAHKGVPAQVRQVPFAGRRDDIQAATGDLLDGSGPDVDALVCAPTGAAAEALPAIRRAGRTVGGDLLLASCVDSPAMRMADPPITSIDLRPKEAGVACVELLFDVMASDVPSPVERVHPVRLNVRASTAPSG